MASVLWDPQHDLYVLVVIWVIPHIPLPSNSHQQDHYVYSAFTLRSGFVAVKKHDENPPHCSTLQPCLGYYCYSGKECIECSPCFFSKKLATSLQGSQLLGTNFRSWMGEKNCLAFKHLWPYINPTTPLQYLRNANLTFSWRPALSTSSSSTDLRVESSEFSSLAGDIVEPCRTYRRGHAHWGSHRFSRLFTSHAPLKLVERRLSSLNTSPRYWICMLKEGFPRPLDGNCTWTYPPSI